MTQAYASIAAAIAKMTDQSDMRVLESCLLTTLHDIFKLDWAAFYQLRGERLVLSSGLWLGELCTEDKPEFHIKPEDDKQIGWTSISSKHGETLGSLRMARAGGFSSMDMVLVECLSRIYDNYLTALRNAQIDKLTGLLNRHTFDEQLESALQLIRFKHVQHDEATPDAHKRREVEDGCFFLGVIDIDHFKQVNDRFGHLYGDEVLIIMARILKQTFRETDLVYRFGGEEFVVIVYTANEQDARTSFERLRHNVEVFDFPQVGCVTISVGYTRMQATMPSVEMLGQADQALYYAKEHGRNQCCFYEQLLADHKVEKQTQVDDFTLF